MKSSELPDRHSGLYLAGVCLVASLGGLLFGFDTAVISGTVQFVRQQFELSELQVGWFGGSALYGCIVGALIAGALGDRFGRKPVLIASALFFFTSALLSTIPPSFIIALCFIDRWGRRSLLIGGMAAVVVSLVVIGCLFLLGSNVGLWIALVMGIYLGCLALSINAVIWVLSPEIFPNRIRGRAMSIATFVNWTTNAATASLFLWYVGQFGMATGFFTFAAICLVATIFFWMLVPETKGKTLEEIERSWTTNK